MRTTVAKVRQIIDTELEDENIVGIIEGASILLDQLFISISMPDTILTEIERWLTAHLIAISKERQAKKEGAGGAYIEYAGEYGSGFEATSYGQTAVALDYSGTLKGLSGKSAKITAIKQN